MKKGEKLMLKLIAIQNHSPVWRIIRNSRQYSSIYKVLEPNGVFFFCKGYELINNSIIKHSDSPKNIQLYSEKSPSIDICAVVGKNGSGKSSLIELYLRLMNNLAYVCHRAINEGKRYNTQFIDEIYTTVFFYETDTDVCYAVKQQGGKLSFLINRVEQFSFNYDKPLESADFQQDVFPTVALAKKCLEELCYTMVINYSAYSYNHEDYLPEWSTVYDNSSNDIRPESERFEDRCWIDSLFHKNDGYQLPIVLNPFRDNGMVDYNNERDLTQDRLYSLTLLQASPITTILNGKVLDRYVFDVDDDLNPVGNKTYTSYKVRTQLQIMGKISKVDGLEAMDVAEDYGKKIIMAWSKCLGVDLASYTIEEKCEDGIKRCPYVLQALNYIVYKTLKITRVYAPYQRFGEIMKDLTGVENYVRMLYENDRSHITQKIRRCLTFIIFRQYKGNKDIQVEQLQRAISRNYNSRKSLMGKAQKNYPFKRYDDVREYDWTEEDFLPAPSFKVILYLKSRGKKQTRIALSTMSSGERQFISSITTLAYHISNIESVWRRMKEDSSEIGYRNVCVFFDEMDLYLHPEYQTKMIQLILKVIEELKLKNVQGIQIICASHSPFILSDIPRDNVMYLDKGKEYVSVKMKTFAANIGDLLCHSFFLSDGLIGCFAKEKVKSLVEWLAPEEDNTNEKEYLKDERKKKEQTTEWTIEKARDFITLLDDPFVKLQLREMLKDYQEMNNRDDEEDKD